MKKSVHIVLCAILMCITYAHAKENSICITIDDLPFVMQQADSSIAVKLTDKILKALQQHKVPAIGFVNEGKLYKDDIQINWRIDILREWLKYGQELGNHTYSHWDANRIPLQQYFADILRGEKVIQLLAKEAGSSIRYFRHPFLRTGKNEEEKQRVDSFLYAHQYTVAPVTIDNSDWIFALAYEKALSKGDSITASTIIKEYIPYMMNKTAFYEQCAKALFNRNIPQILLLHANRLNGDCLDDLLAAYSAKNYQFISLEKALADTAYQSDDCFTGYGISWLHRWAKTRKMPHEFYQNEPGTPRFIMEIAGVQHE